MERKEYHTYSFEKLEAWQTARNLRNRIYKLSRKFPDEEKYGIISQIRRSSNSITDNLAEGSGRASNTDRAYFVNIAYSSGLEALNQLITSHDQGYITDVEYETLRRQFDQLIHKLNAFYRYLINEGKSVKDRFRE
jgi:four helix bundle protein